MHESPQAKKHLGQHFLVDISYCRRIALFAAGFRPGPVVEIGAGTGFLTRQLLREFDKVVAVEVDRDLIHRLLADFDAEIREHRLEVVQADILDCDWSHLDRLAFKLPSEAPATGADRSLEGIEERKVTIVGNLPYYIATRIIQSLLPHAGMLAGCVFMTQREVADRLEAKPGSPNYGYLSVMVQQCFQVTLAFHVPPGAFRPRPKVDSSIVRLDPHRVLPPPHELEVLTHVLQSAFRHPRKTIRNNLLQAGYPTDTIEAALQAAGINAGDRPGSVPGASFRILAGMLSSSA